MKEIVVGSDNFEIAISPQRLRSGEFEPCIVIGAFDKMNKRGYMFHFADLFFDKESLDEFIETILRESLPENLDFYLCGGSVEDEDTDTTNYRNTNRYAALEKINKFFYLSNVTINWSEPYTINELILDTVSGKFIYCSEIVGE